MITGGSAGCVSTPIPNCGTSRDWPTWARSRSSCRLKISSNSVTVGIV